MLQNKLENCRNCKELTFSKVFDSTGGLGGTFCSAECLQKLKLRLVKSQSTNSNIQESRIKQLKQPNHSNSASKGSLTQASDSFFKHQVKSEIDTVPASKNSSKPPPLVSLHEKPLQIPPLISLDSDDSDNPVSAGTSNELKSNNNYNPKKNCPLPQKLIMSDTEVSKPSTSNLHQLRTSSTSTLTNSESSKLSINSPSSSTSSSSSSTNVNNAAKAKQPPTYHYETYSVFDWDSYLREAGGKPAPANCFKQNVNYPENEFQIGMKLEAKDPRNPSSSCIATVVALFGLRIQLRLDGSDNANDFWELVDSENIHPIGHCNQIGEMLQPPLGFRRNPSQFSLFLVQTLKDAIHAPESAFKPPPPAPKANYFKVGMKLEAVDRKNPRLICPATIGQVDGRNVFITFDGWKGAFDYMCDYTSRDLFPVGWCAKTGHPLQPTGHKAPTEHTKAKMMSMTSHTSMSLALQNSKNERSSKVKSPVIESKKSLSNTGQKSTNGMSESNGDSSKHKNNDSGKKQHVRIKLQTPMNAQSASKSKVTLTVTPSSKNETSSNGKGDTSKNPISNVKASASSTVTTGSKRSIDEVSSRETSRTLAQVETSKTVKVFRETNETLSEDQQCQISSSTKPKVSTSTSHSANSSASKSIDSPSSPLPLNNPEIWNVDQVIEYLLSIDKTLATHADVFKSHVSLKFAFVTFYLLSNSLFFYSFKI